MLLIDDINKPVETLCQPFALECTAPANRPISILEMSQVESIAEFSRCDGMRRILFVSEHQEGRVFEFGFFVENASEFFGDGRKSINVCRVHHEDYGCRVGIVASPIGPDRRLAA